MNLKVQFGKSVHKLNKDVKSLQEIIKFVYSVYKEKIPLYFDFQYEDDGEVLIVNNDEDLRIAREECQKKNKGLKLVIIEGKQNECELMLQSFICIQKDDESWKGIGQQAEQSQIIKEDLLKELKNENIKVVEQKDVEKVQKKDESDKKQDQKIIFEEEKQAQLTDIKSLEMKKQSQFQDEKKAFQQPIIGDIMKIDQSKMKIPYYCIYCHQDQNPKCAVCNGTRQMPENSLLVQIFEQVIDRKLQQYGLIPKKQIQEQIQKPVQTNEKKEIDLKTNPVEIQQMDESALRQSNLIRYKAQLFKDPPSLFVVPQNSQKLVNWDVQLKNNGNQVWPENTQFYQISNELNEYLASGQQVCQNRYIGGLNIFNIQYRVPSVPVSEMVHWRLGYEDQGQIKYFGPKVTFEMRVVKSDQVGQKPNSVVQVMQMQQQEVNSQKKVNPQIANNAQQMSEIFGGNADLYVNFIEELKLEDYPYEQLVNMYMEKQQL